MVASHDLVVRQIRSDSTPAAHDLPNPPAPRAATGPRLAGHPAGIAALALALAQRGGAKAPTWCVMMKVAEGIPGLAAARAPPGVL